MKLSEYKNEQNQQETNKNKAPEKSVEDLYNTYKNMNQSELMQTLFSEVAKQKQQGSFDYNKLQNSLNQVMPYLNDEQKKNLLTILQQLK